MKKFTLILFACLLFIACKDDPAPPTCPDADTLCAAILQEDQDRVAELVNQLADDLTPNANTSDPIGHEKNLDTLIERLDDCSCIEASKICYGCIETLPVQSEIRVEVELNGEQIIRVLDILTPDNEVLTFAGMHE